MHRFVASAAGQRFQTFLNNRHTNLAQTSVLRYNGYESIVYRVEDEDTIY